MDEVKLLFYGYLILSGFCLFLVALCIAIVSIFSSDRSYSFMELFGITNIVINAYVFIKLLFWR